MVVRGGCQDGLLGELKPQGEVGAEAVVVVDDFTDLLVVFEHVGDAEIGGLLAVAGGEPEAAAGAEQATQFDEEVFVVLELAEKFVGVPGGVGYVVAQVLEALVDKAGVAGLDELHVGDGKDAAVVVLKLPLEAAAEADDGLGVFDPVEV